MEFFKSVGAALPDNAWGVPVFVTVFATLLAHYLVKRLFDRLARRFERTDNIYDDAILAAARKPIRWGIWSLGLLFAAELAGRGSTSELVGYIDPLRDVLVVVLLAWFVERAISLVEAHVTDPNYRPDPMDRATAGAISKLLRVSVLITAMLMAMQSLGFSIAGLLAFGGLGGIAVGFAARDLLANCFGALTIFLDRPFAVGDWIRSPDRDIEGTVEAIGWRLTRIRTFDLRPLYVPNSAFTTLSVENPSRMHNRRIYEIIGVRYDDIGVLPALIGDVRRLLANHDGIAADRLMMVNFLRFGPSSLDFMIYAYTKTVVWTEYHALKEDILFEIARIIYSHGAAIAFPTRTVQIARPPSPEP